MFFLVIVSRRNPPAKTVWTHLKAGSRPNKAIKVKAEILKITKATERRTPIADNGVVYPK